MDDLVLALNSVCEQFLPILGCAVLIALFIVFIKLIGLLKTVNETLLKSHKTIGLVDQSIEKIQQPLDTVVKVSGTVDKAHDATLKAVDSAKEYVVKNAEIIKDKLETMRTKKEEVKEPSPEDIIGGK